MSLAENTEPRDRVLMIDRTTTVDGGTPTGSLSFVAGYMVIRGCSITIVEGRVRLCAARFGQKAEEVIVKLPSDMRMAGTYHLDYSAGAHNARPRARHCIDIISSMREIKLRGRDTAVIGCPNSNGWLVSHAVCLSAWWSAELRAAPPLRMRHLTGRMSGKPRVVDDNLRRDDDDVDLEESDESSIGRGPALLGGCTDASGATNATPTTRSIALAQSTFNMGELYHAQLRRADTNEPRSAAKRSHRTTAAE